GIENQEVGLRLAESFPDVIETDSLKGNLPIDVLRSDQSEMLLNESSSKGLKAGIVSFAEKGGVVLIPLALIIIWALFLIIERLVFYGVRFRTGRRSVDRAVELIESDKFQEAKAVTAGAKGIMPEIFNEIVSDIERTREDAERRVKERLLSEVPKLDKHLDTIAVLAAASPLLGLLGTVTGMIDMFDTITRFGTREPQLLAGGISEALVTTETGLIIAIPLLIIHNFLRNRRNSIQAEMERNSVTILNRIWPES
ncbi:MAG: MotA/TolQ/ExbB proton channel family protein, partial [Chitinivibrionales bacterium]